MLEEYGLILVRHPLPFKVNHVNSFLAEGKNGWKIIDAGLHNEDIKNRWEQELHGRTVTDIIVTHYHPDH
ncbi:MBL fold metallo-hydrolase [Oceanobacillus salinisoli]|uniref:MBL fold metallo-hydrolase n=1 Tax=Oceanobacillus salinisoli TaxID=2678611 RepID=UPI001E3AFBB7|nr:MBL fold metallo-hydrolase [Oceanobacillus salinisoli]